MVKINAPNKEYTGISASVYFINGAGETENPYLVEWFREKGYEVIENTEDEVADEKPKKKK